MKIAVITCHNQPDYVQAVTIRRAIQHQPNTEVFILKNKYTGILRFPEVTLRLIWLRITKHPDAYVLTFRGFEILPATTILTWPKKLIFDELINPVEWLQESRAELWAKFIPQGLLKSFYRLLLRRVTAVISDTPEHALYSAKLLGLPSAKFVSLPVGTDEEIFYPRKAILGKTFKVFYYGNMLPLHGLDIVLAVAEKLKDESIEFEFSGGTPAVANMVRQSIQRGAHIKYHTWIPFNQLPDHVASSNLTLGGPFGKTTQASYVITGKTYQFIASGKANLIGANNSSQLFKDRENCLTVPLGDVDALVLQLKWAMNHPKELEAIGIAGHKLYEEHFSSQQLAKHMAQIFKKYL